MSPHPYIPPKQSGKGQLFDSLCLVVLILVFVFGPLAFGKDQTPTVTRTLSSASWQALGQNDAMASAWQRLGYSPETAKPLIEKRYSYDIDVAMLTLAVLTIFAYFLVLLHISRKEYHDVISERFDH